MEYIDRAYSGDINYNRFYSAGIQNNKNQKHTRYFSNDVYYYDFGCNPVVNLWNSNQRSPDNFCKFSYFIISLYDTDPENKL